VVAGPGPLIGRLGIDVLRTRFSIAWPGPDKFAMVRQGYVFRFWTDLSGQGPHQVSSAPAPTWLGWLRRQYENRSKNIKKGLLLGEIDGDFEDWDTGCVVAKWVSAGEIPNSRSNIKSLCRVT